MLGLYKVRWQDDQGVPRWEALVSVFRSSEGGPPEVDPEFFGSLLVRGQRDDGDAVVDANIERRNEVLAEINRRANEELASRCTVLRHPNDIVMLAAADMVTEGITTSPERALPAS